MKTILQIEDNTANQRLVERVLEPYNYRLLHAADGETGVDIALKEKPDLILLDMGLPDIDGQTVAAIMKGIPELKDIPIIAVTAWPAATALQMAERYGCDDLITKPIDVKTFPAQIAKHLVDDT